MYEFRRNRLTMQAKYSLKISLIFQHFKYYNIVMRIKIKKAVNMLRKMYHVGSDSNTDAMSNEVKCQGHQSALILKPMMRRLVVQFAVITEQN